MELFLLAAALALVAALYSSVGHGGASGYLAVMAIAGFAPEELRPTALLLNIIVASIATWRFSAHFRWPLFWPFAVASIPCAFLAGRWIHLDVAAYQGVLGLVLLYAAWRLIGFRTQGSKLQSQASDVDSTPRRLSTPLALAAGTGIGLISGTIGVGGGIFLSPLIVLAGWAQPRQAAAIAAPFILLNSASALAGLGLHAGGPPAQPERLAIFAGTVLVAGFLGSSFGAGRLDQRILNRLLGIVLIVAGGKMILAAAGLVR